MQVLLRRDSSTRKGFYTDVLWHTLTSLVHTNTFAPLCFFRYRRFSHTHACSFTGIALNAHASTQRFLHGDAFTHGNAFTRTFFTQRYQRWIYTEELCALRCHYKQRCFYKGGTYTRSCFIRTFLHRHTLTWYRMADTNSMRKNSASRCKTRISPQLLMI